MDPGFRRDDEPNADCSHSREGGNQGWLVQAYRRDKMDPGFRRDDGMSSSAAYRVAQPHNLLELERDLFYRSAVGRNRQICEPEERLTLLQ
jgi:hypothetical protein